MLGSNKCHLHQGQIFSPKQLMCLTENIIGKLIAAEMFMKFSLFAETNIHFDFDKEKLKGSSMTKVNPYINPLTPNDL
jgi:outer membrane protein OmpA-like peptidoglycan-associated protein